VESLGFLRLDNISKTKILCSHFDIHTANKAQNIKVKLRLTLDNVQLFRKFVKLVTKGIGFTLPYIKMGCSL